MSMKKMISMSDKMIDISVTNLARVHARNKELSEAVKELHACLSYYAEINIVGNDKHNRVKNALALYRDLS